ncbi:hypothetical protein ACH4VM_25515 [Streptomyces sp. NPDC020792]|uniref:hypothetical protein n=1 Tax=Streptomyces sp. NPDC020792 TaxID=3365089 RepID=UPI0037A74DAF
MAELLVQANSTPAYLTGDGMAANDIRDWLYDPIGVLRVISQENENGEWVRVAEYLDIPGCVAVAETAEEAVAAVEELKQQHIDESRLLAE